MAEAPRTILNIDDDPQDWEMVRLALATAQVGIWDWDLVKGLMRWNPEHEQLFGLPANSFDGNPATFDRYLHPDDRDPLHQAIQQAIHEHHSYHHEFRILWADGSIHWVEGRGNVIYSDTGQPIRVVGTLLNIDARKPSQLLLQQQVNQQQLIMKISQHIRQSLALQDILQIAVDEVRQLLHVDRVIIVRFMAGRGGTVTVESVENEAFTILPFDIADACIGDQYMEQLKQGTVTAQSDIYSADISPCDVEFLAQFQVRATLVVPIFKNDELWGLLAAHHCTAPRHWQNLEIDLLQQIASQVSIALQQSALLEQVELELAERKQAELALQRSEERFHVILQEMPVMLDAFDKDGTIVAWNHECEQVTGFLASEVLGNSDIMEQFYPDSAYRNRMMREWAERGNNYRNWEWDITCKNGDIRTIAWFNISTLVSIPEWAVWGIGVDVTDRKRAEHRLQQLLSERNELLLQRNLILEQMPIGCVINDPEFRIVFWNQTAEHIFGFTQDEVIGKHPYEICVPDTAKPTIEDVCSRLTERNTSIHSLNENMTKDGRTIICQWTNAPLVTEEGEMIGFLSMVQDVTEQKQAAAALEQAKTELEQRVTQRTAELTQVNDRLLVALDEQAQTEAALRDSEERRRLALDLTHIGFWDLHLSSGAIICNDNYFRLLGLAPDHSQPNYELWRNRVHPDDLGGVEQQFLNAIENHIDYAAEYRVVYPDDSTHWVMARAQGIYDKTTGQPLRALGVLLDISDRKQAEEALRQSDERFRQLAENIEAVFWMRDVKKQQVIYVSPAYEAIWQKSCEHLYQNFSDWIDAIHPDDRLRVATAALHLDTMGHYDEEYRIFRPNRSIRWIRDRAFSIRNEAGEMVRVAGLAEDITERKQAEQTLALQAVITRNMAEGICLVRVDNGLFVYANPKFEQMFGYGSGELNGQHVSIVNYAPGSIAAEEINQTLRAAVLQNSEATYEVHNVKKDGTPFWCSATSSIFQHPEYGDVLVAVHQDITDRKQAEAALQQQTTQKQLLWNITQAIRQSLDLDVTLNAAVTEVRQLLNVDRVAVYRFNSNWSGDFIVESVVDNWVKLVKPNVCKVWEDTYLQETQGGRFQNHETLIVTDIYTADLQPCHVDLLQQFQARAYAIAPIFVGNLLWGLFAIYQNSAPRRWVSWEIELLQQITSQLAIALQQSELYEQLQVELQERKQAAAVLREAERRWRSLLDNVQLIVVGLNQAGQANYVNPFFLSLTGYTESEVIGKSWFENFLPASQQETVRDIVMHNPYPYYQNSILTKSGEERFIAWNSTTLQDADGAIIGTISIGEDITERQRVEKMKNEFISIVSHELRTPLTSIRGSLGLLATGVMDDEPDEMKRMIDIAAIDTERLVRLVNDVLDLEKLESGKVSLVREWCNAADLMQRSIEVMESSAQEAGVRLVAQPLSVQIWVAPDRIIQTFTNLLSNAIKFSPSGETVTLAAEIKSRKVGEGKEIEEVGRIEEVGEGSSPPPPYPSPSSPPHPLTPPSLHPFYILFSIQDQGRGIPVDKLETIFGRFQQVDASDSRDKGGTGLGLAICKSIVQQHEGQIWVESRWGEGSTFFFTLPLLM